jgi:competence ComEA-like helix-hairpin-helix protein
MRLGCWLAALVVSTGGAAAQIQLPEGPGKDLALRMCKGCHELERSFSVRRDRRGWDETMSKMVTLGAKGTPEEIEILTEYLAKHFPADELPPENVNKAKQIELESRLSLPRSQAGAIIEHRARHGPFKSFEDLKKVPGVSLEKLEAKRSVLVF